jgi:hypothetical protein
MVGLDSRQLRQSLKSLTNTLLLPRDKLETSKASQEYLIYESMPDDQNLAATVHQYVY